jgi:hypothetical protein
VEYQQPSVSLLDAPWRGGSITDIVSWSSSWSRSQSPDLIAARRSLHPNFFSGDLTTSQNGEKTMSQYRFAVLGLMSLGIACVTGPVYSAQTAQKPSAPDDAPAPTYKVDPNWRPQLPTNQLIGDVPDISIDSKNNVWIFQRADTLLNNTRGAISNPPEAACCKQMPEIIQMDPNGKILQSWGGPGWDHWPVAMMEHTPPSGPEAAAAAKGPPMTHGQEHGLFVDHDGNVWITGYSIDANNGYIMKFSNTGKFLMQIGSDKGIGSTPESKLSQDPNVFGWPTRIAEDPKNHLLIITDGYVNQRVIEFDSQTGKFIRMWGAYGKQPNGITDMRAKHLDDPNNPRFDTPHGIAISPDGLLYIADRGNNRIQIFKEDGTYVTQWVYQPQTKWPGSVWDVAIPETDPDYLVYIDGTNNTLNVVRRSDGKLVHSYGRTGHYAGEFIYGHDIAIDHQGNVYTGEVAGGQRIQKWIRQ